MADKSDHFNTLSMDSQKRYLEKLKEKQIITRKLLFDGDGTGDERRLNLLQRMIVKWMLVGNESQEEIKSMYDKICFQMNAMEHSRKKSELMKLAYEKQTNCYKAYQKQMESNITSIKNAIEVSKALLAEVKYTKFQKLGYDLIAKDIEAEPSRQDTSKRVEELSKQIVQLNNSKTKLNSEWSRCRKQFSVIATSANQLRMLLEDRDINEILD